MSISHSNFPTAILARLTDDGGPVHAVKFSSGTGQYLLTGCQDRSIRLFNPATRRLVQKFSGHGYEVLDLDVSQDNASLVSGGGDKSVFVWDVARAVNVRRFAGHSARVNCVSFGAEGDSVVVSGSFDGTVKVWDLRSRGDSKAIMTLTEAKDSVSSVSVRGHEITAASVDGRVRVYDLAGGDISVDTVAPGKGVTSVISTRDGEAYLASCLGSELRLMDRASGKCLQTFQDLEGDFRNETYRIRSTLAVADGVAVSGSENGKVVAWDVVTGAVIHRLSHKDSSHHDVRQDPNKRYVVSAVAWSPVRKHWASAGGDGTVLVWGDAS